MGVSAPRGRDMTAKLDFTTLARILRIALHLARLRGNLFEYLNGYFDDSFTTHARAACQIASFRAVNRRWRDVVDAFAWEKAVIHRHNDESRLLVLYRTNAVAKVRLQSLIIAQQDNMVSPSSSQSVIGTRIIKQVAHSLSNLTHIGLSVDVWLSIPADLSVSETCMLAQLETVSLYAGRSSNQHSCIRRTVWPIRHNDHRIKLIGRAREIALDCLIVKFADIPGQGQRATEGRLRLDRLEILRTNKCMLDTLQDGEARFVSLCNDIEDLDLSLWQAPLLPGHRKELQGVFPWPKQH